MLEPLADSPGSGLLATSCIKMERLTTANGGTYTKAALSPDYTIEYDVCGLHLMAVLEEIFTKCLG
jgi:hypothetical protein